MGGFMRVGIAVLCLAALSGCTTPPPPAAPAAKVASSTATTTGASASDPDRIICTSDPVTGSHLGAKRTCRTARQWAQVDIDAKRNPEKYQGSQSPMSPVQRTPGGGP